MKLNGNYKNNSLSRLEWKKKGEEGEGKEKKRKKKKKKRSEWWFGVIAQ